MTICCLSDIHGYLPDVPECDLLLLGGDYCRNHKNTAWYVTDFNNWLKVISKRGTKIIGVAGNHDFYLERPSCSLKESEHWTYLQDSETNWNDLTIWGSPWQPRFYDWAFNLDEPELAEKWAMIPDNIDILLLHGPPHGIGDFSPYSKVHTGSPSLTKRIREVKPLLVVCGHIHDCYGQYRIDDTIVVNASHVDEEYRPVNAPMIIEMLI